MALAEGRCRMLAVGGVWRWHAYVRMCGWQLQDPAGVLVHLIVQGLAFRGWRLALRVSVQGLAFRGSRLAFRVSVHDLGMHTCVGAVTYVGSSDWARCHASHCCLQSGPC